MSKTSSSERSTGRSPLRRHSIPRSLPHPDKYQSPAVENADQRMLTNWHLIARIWVRTLSLTEPIKPSVECRFRPELPRILEESICLPRDLWVTEALLVVFCRDLAFRHPPSFRKIHELPEMQILEIQVTNEIGVSAINSYTPGIYPQNSARIFAPCNQRNW